MLFDFYGPLLTDRQRDVFRMYFQEDLSLAEIGEELDISRQAVYDLLKRVQVSLEELESKLHLVERHGQRQAFYQEILSDLESLNCEGEQNTAVVNGLKDKIRRVQGGLD